MTTSITLHSATRATVHVRPGLLATLLGARPEDYTAWLLPDVGGVAWFRERGATEHLELVTDRRVIAALDSAFTAAVVGPCGVAGIAGRR